MDLVSMIAAVEACACHRAARKLLRKEAVGCLVLGAFVITSGMAQLREYEFPAVLLTVIGAGLIASGVASLAWPRPLTVLFAGYALATAGAYNLVVSALNIAYGTVDPNIVEGFALGIITFAWGWRMQSPRSKMAAMRLSEPSPAMSKEIDAIAGALRYVREDQGNDCFHFLRRHIRGTTDYYGRLGDDVCTLTDAEGVETHFLLREDLYVIPKNSRIRKNDNKVRLRMRDETVTAIVSQISLERMLRWKERETAEVPETVGPAGTPG